MVNFLLGQQGRCTKYPCFLCYWDSRAAAEHWVKKELPQRQSLASGDKNVINDPLVGRKMHLKLGLMKQFVRALDHSGECFSYICSTFNGLSEEKKNAGIFDGPQIRRLMRDANFITSMNETEKKSLECIL